MRLMAARIPVHVTRATEIARGLLGNAHPDRPGPRKVRLTDINVSLWDNLIANRPKVTLVGADILSIGRRLHRGDVEPLHGAASGRIGAMRTALAVKCAGELPSASIRYGLS